ncbi:cell wall protein DAN4-like isoform X1 [Daphnia pulex]|uniref:cell wall protein DAN4-like isoform X1 n=1 Tax=Daphnia pulex TaxID=6669 RepID=UPI001EDE194E|nr:cell wall protein DAN4-like isoform X1 [Daphnia pulex]
MKNRLSTICALQVMAAYLLPLASTARISKATSSFSPFQSYYNGIPSNDNSYLVSYFYTTPVIIHAEYQQPLGPFFGYFPNLLTSPCSPCPLCPAAPDCPSTPPTCPETTTANPTTSTTTTAETTTTTPTTTTTTTAAPATCPTCPSCTTCPATTTPTTCPTTTTTTTAAPPTCPTCPTCLTCPETTTPTTCPTTTTATTAAPPTCPTCASCIACPVPPPSPIVTACDNALNAYASAAPNGTISVNLPTANTNFNCQYSFVAYPPTTRIVVRCSSISAGARFRLSPATPQTAGVLGVDYTSMGTYLIMTANNLLSNVNGIQLSCTWQAV